MPACNKTVLLSVFVLVAFFASSSGAISSSEAQDKAASYLGADAKDVISLSKLLKVGADSYWVFFYSIYSPKRILIVVSDFEGEVVEDKQRLWTVGQAAYKYSAIEEYLKAKGWGFSLMEPAVSSSISVIYENQRKLSDFSLDMQLRYPQLSFREVEAGLSRLSDEAVEIEAGLKDGESLESIFASDYSSGSLSQLASQYNASLRSLSSFFADYDAYGKAISDTERQVYNANITDPDFTNINKNLESLRDVGISDLYAKFKREKPLEGFNALLAGSDKWVNDSIESFLFRKKRYDANRLIDDNRAEVEGVIRAEAYYAACGFADEVAQLKRGWDDVEYYLEKSAFERVIEKTPGVAANASSIKARCAARLSPTPYTRLPENEFDLSALLGWLLPVLLIAAIYFYWKKQGEQPPEGAETL